MRKTIYTKINSSRRKEFRVMTKIIKDDGLLIVEKTGLNGNEHINNMYSKIMEYSRLYKENLVLPMLKENTLSYPLIEGELLVNAYTRGEEDKVIEILHSLLDKEENLQDFESSEAFVSLFGDVEIPESTKAFKISNIDMILENIIISKDKVIMIDLEWIFDFPIPKDFVLYRIYKDCMRIKPSESFEEKFMKSFDIRMELSILEKMDEAFLSHVNEEQTNNQNKEESYISNALNDDQKEIDRLNIRIKELGVWGQNLDNKVQLLDKRINQLQDEVLEKNKHIEKVSFDAKENEENLSNMLLSRDIEIKEKDETIVSQNKRIDELGDWGKELDEKLSKTNERIVELQDEVLEKNKHIEKVSLDAKENETLLTSIIGKKDEEIKEKDESIVSLNNRINELGLWGNSLNDSINSLNERINELQNEVEEKNEHIESVSLEAKKNEENLLSIIKNDEEEILEKDKTISSLNDRVEELSLWGKKLDEKIELLGKRINELQDEVIEKNKHIETISLEAKKNEENLSNMLLSKENEIKEKDETIVFQSKRIDELEDLEKELGEKLSKSNDRVDELQTEIEEKNKNIEELKNKEDSLLNEINEKDSKILSLNNDIKERNNEINSLNSRIEEKNNEATNLNNKINQQLERIITLQNEEEERNIHIKKLDGEIDVLRERSNKLHEIEKSTFYKVAKAYYKVRDFFIPMGSKRKAFLKLLGMAIRHPIWTIKHLTPENVRKFKKYSKSEGLARALERTDVYQGNTAEIEYAKKLDLISMKPHDEYPVLEFPKFKDVKVSIVIPVYNQFSYTYGCLAMILKNAGDVPYEVIIGDDCSTDETKDILSCIKNIKVARTKENSRFVLNNNNAAKKAKGEYIYFLNNDTNVQPGFLSSLVETIESDPTIGMVGSKLVYPNGMLQEAGGILWRDGSAWNYGYKGDANASEYNYRKETDYISGAAIMIKRSLWEEIGGFDTRFVPAYCEDSDLAFEVRKHGYKVVYDPFSVVVHYEGISNGTDINSGLKKYQVDNTKKFYEKWKDVLKEHYPNAENVFVARERSYKKKTLLVIDHYVPTYDKDAGSRTVFGYLKLFVKMGYNVKFMGENFYQSEPYTTTLQKMGVEVLYGPYYYHNWRTWIKEVGENIDLVLFNRPHITKVFIDDVKASCPNAKFMYYGHDLHYMRLNREFEITGNEEARKESISWKEKEWELFKKVDLVLYPSKVETEEIAKTDNQIKAKVLQPYLFDNIKQANYDFNNRKDLLFVGGFRHGPNVDGIMWFIKEVFPKILEKHPDIKLTVAGAFAPQDLINCQNEHIKVTGFISDEELDKLYKTSRIVVVPLRYGAGIKGKVIEAMFNGVPVVTTACGAEGVETDALVVDETLLAVNELYENKEKLKELSKKEYEFMKNSYSMDKAEISFKEMVDDLNK